MNTLIAIIGVVILCLFGAGGSLFLKKASNKIRFDRPKSLFNSDLILGIALYIISAGMIVALLKFNDLSFIYPLTALTYVFVTLISWKYLNEKINIYKIAAISLIVIGVALVAMS